MSVCVCVRDRYRDREAERGGALCLWAAGGGKEERDSCEPGAAATSQPLFRLFRKTITAAQAHSAARLHANFPHGDAAPLLHSCCARVQPVGVDYVTRAAAGVTGAEEMAARGKRREKKAFLIGDANVTFLPLQPAVGGRAAEDD